ncbi:MAG TPA: SDR family oxidoreductase [Streptosporangiaceae bacterium]|nr:SDR family oxidoreductase [Streptosporangiaceae bacterium]
MTKIGDRRVIVVGASRGIGATIALRLAHDGARVAFAGRSTDLLAAAAAQYPDRTAVVGCDVRDPDACAAAIGEAAAALGGLDALVYATGVTRFGEMAEATADDWHVIFDTNVIGAALITSAALPHLAAAGGNAIYLSSHTASQQPPWAGIGPYICSKAALERMVQCWQHENPLVAFTTIAIGPTASSIRESQPEGARFGAEWMRQGLFSGRQLDGEEHAAMVAHILTSPARIEAITVVPR